MPGPIGTTRAAKLAAGPVLAAAIWVFPAPMPSDAWLTVGLAAWMVTWWILEPVPLAATALLPVVFVPVLGLGTVLDATATFGDPVIFLFLGGFLLAASMQHWRLHERIALWTVLRVGPHPSSAIAGFLVATAAVSMWVSNTAAAVMMLPMALSVAAWAHEGLRRRFGAALALAIAYGATIGGLGTLIGTPPNAFAAAFLRSEHGLDVGFGPWMVATLPLVALGLAAAWWLLAGPLFRLRQEPELEGGSDAMRARLAALGDLSRPEARVGAVFILAIVAWLARPLVDARVPITDTAIAVGAAVLLFILPSGTGRPLLTWNEARGIPWQVLLLFGGGLALAGAMVRSGLATWIGDRLAAIDAPILVLIIVFAGVVLLLTELASNTAIAAAMLPVAAAVAVARGDDPRLLVVPVALAASAAFMLPVATPPNAVVYGSGLLSVKQMARAGVWLNILFLGLVSLHGAFVAPRVFGY